MAFLLVYFDILNSQRSLLRGLDAEKNSRAAVIVVMKIESVTKKFRKIFENFYASDCKSAKKGLMKTQDRNISRSAFS